jgi:hypothetical protein
VQGSPFEAGVPMQAPLASQDASLMQLFWGSQGAPAGRATSMQAPPAGSHAATLHGELAAGQTPGCNSQTPKAQTATAEQAPLGEQSLPFGFAAATQAPVAASQSPSVQGLVKDEQSLGCPEQTPFWQVPVEKQPLTPHVPPEVGWYSQLPVAALHATVLQSRSMHLTGRGSGTQTPARQTSCGVHWLWSASHAVSSGLNTDRQPPLPSHTLETTHAPTEQL